jgi:hypothetical protein
VHLKPPGATVAALDGTYSIYSGVDHLGTVGKAAPGLFAQEGRCWRMVYENVAGHAGRCPEPVTWAGRWKFLMAVDQLLRQTDLRAASRAARMVPGLRALNLDRAPIGR